MPDEPGCGMGSQGTPSAGISDSSVAARQLYLRVGPTAVPSEQTNLACKKPTVENSFRRIHPP